MNKEKLDGIAEELSRRFIERHKDTPKLVWMMLMAENMQTIRDVLELFTEVNK